VLFLSFFLSSPFYLSDEQHHSPGVTVNPCPMWTRRSGGSHALTPAIASRVRARTISKSLRFTIILLTPTWCTVRNKIKREGERACALPLLPVATFLGLDSPT